MSEPQLILRRANMDDLPPLELSDGLYVHTHEEGKEKEWEELIEAAFGHKYSFDKFIRNGGGYKPEYVFYIAKDGKDIATATAIENEKYPGEGWLRMVGTHPEARGQGVGKKIMIAALRSLKERGYKSAVLSTDDRRIPAIALYLSLGFEPLMTHESHEERWKAVMEAVNAGRKK